MFSEFIPVSHEAFALLLHKNGHSNWIWMYDMLNASSSDDTDASNDVEKPGHLCTCTRADKGACWSGAGMEAFNSLHAKIKASRAANNGEFDTHYKIHWRSRNCVSKYRKRRLTDAPPLLACVTQQHSRLGGSTIKVTNN